MRKFAVLVVVLAAALVGLAPTAAARDYWDEQFWPGSTHSHRSHEEHRGDRGNRGHFTGDRSDYDDESDDDGSEDGDDSSDTSVDVEDGTADSGSVVAPTNLPTGAQRTITIRSTGFSWFDNSPPSSATVCCGKWHKTAGGTGTRDNPITVAVPGSGGQGMEFPAGTLFYSSKLRRYLGVEDSGASKFDQPHLDIWVAGQGFSRSSSDRCMSEITGTQQVIVNPPAGLPVNAGPLTGANGCNL